MTSLLTTDELANDVSGAEAQLTRHQEYRAEIDTRQKGVNDFQQTADRLVADRHSACADIEEKSQRLQVAWDALQETWQERYLELEQNKEVQVFKRDADQLEAWLNARETDVESEDVGDSLEAVEELLKKQDEFEKMLLTQERKFLGLNKLTQHEVDVGRRRGTNDERMMDLHWSDAEDEENQEMERREKEEWERREREELERREREELERREREEWERREREEWERREKEELERAEIDKRRKEEEQREKEEMDRRKKEEVKRREAEEQKRKEREEKERERRKQEDMAREEAARRSRLAEQEKIQQKVKERQRIQWERTESLDKNRNISDDSEETLCEGLLQRKQEFEAGARKTHARAWKTFHTVLRGTEPELVFFKEKKDVHQKIYAAPSMNLKGAWCEEAKDYTKRKNVFRLVSRDDAEFLFVAKDLSDVSRWVEHLVRVTGQLRSSPSPPPPQAPEEFRFPLITVTSIDNEEEPVVYDDDPPSPPLDIPPPVLPLDMDLQEETPDRSDSPDRAHVPMLPDIPPPDVPDILPPDVPPFEFSDLEESGVDDEDEEDEDDVMAPPLLPTSPPPPLHPPAENGVDTSSKANTNRRDYRAPSPPAYVPTQFERPSPPLRKKHKVPPPVAPKPEGRSRSGTQNSCSSTDSAENVPRKAAPKPPVAPKPVAFKSAAGGSERSVETKEEAGAARKRESPVLRTRSAVRTQEVSQEEKKPDKKKGMFGNIFKKKR